MHLGVAILPGLLCGMGILPVMHLGVAIPPGLLCGTGILPVIHLGTAILPVILCMTRESRGLGGAHALLFLSSSAVSMAVAFGYANGVKSSSSQSRRGDPG